MRVIRHGSGANAMKSTIALIVAFLAAAPVVADSAPPFQIVETGRSYWRLDDAFKQIGEGQVTILVAPGTYRDCASQTAGDLTLKAARPGSVIFDSTTCEGKAALVLKGRSARIDGIIFQNMRVSDQNGAGIRLEKGDLTVTNSMFRNSEQGILSGSDPAGQIVIDRTTFSGLGGCPNGMCSHSIYIGDYGKLTVTRTRFEKGTGGHYVKTRSAEVLISDNSFDDTQGHATNYMIDLSAGARGVIEGNTFVQGMDKENHSAFIAVAAEARSNPSAGLIIRDNDASLSPAATWPAVFVADWSHEPLQITANRLGPKLQKFETR
jgi:Right handed beta helix region